MCARQGYPDWVISHSGLNGIHFVISVGSGLEEVHVGLLLLKSQEHHLLTSNGVGDARPHRHPGHGPPMLFGVSLFGKAQT